MQLYAQGLRNTNLCVFNFVILREVKVIAPLGCYKLGESTVNSHIAPRLHAMHQWKSLN